MYPQFGPCLPQWGLAYLHIAPRTPKLLAEVINTPVLGYIALDCSERQGTLAELVQDCGSTAFSLQLGLFLRAE